MFNADLALSVTMTAISTILAPLLMPLNLFIYARFSYDDDILATLDWNALVYALLIVILGIIGGLGATAYHNSPDFHLLMNRIGNAAGICLVIFSAIMSNTDADARIWNREWEFYVAVAIPCIVGLVVANIITSLLGLVTPERVAVSIECCYQNVGIATSVALSMFDGEGKAKASAVPFYYGSVEALCLLIYCVGAWKAGWTKAPPDVSFWHMLSTSYEVLSQERVQEDGSGAMVDDDFIYVDHQDKAIPAPSQEMREIRSQKEDLP